MSDKATIHESSGVLQLVSFSIGEEEYGVDILKVREINRMLDVTHLPDAPPFVEGVINLRGKVVPIIDLRGRLGMEKKARDKNTRIVVVELAARVVGFIVDAVREVLRIERDITELPPQLAAGNGGEYITGIAKLEDKLLILLDLEKAVNADSLQEIQEVSA